MFVRTILIAMAGFAVFGAQAASAQNFWEVPLRWQLHNEQRCEFGYPTNLRVTLTDGRQTVTGRAHCRDGRAFEVVRTDALLQFALRQCLVDGEA